MVVVGMMSESVGQGVAVVIMVVMSRREGVDVEEVGRAEEVGMEEEMMEEAVLISEGCRMLDGVDEVGGALLLRRLGHLCGGMLRLTGGDICELFALEFSFTYAVLYL
jgi:hypothetical protein